MSNDEKIIAMLERHERSIDANIAVLREITASLSDIKTDLDVVKKDISIVKKDISDVKAVQALHTQELKYHTSVLNQHTQRLDAIEESGRLQLEHSINISGRVRELERASGY